MSYEDDESWVTRNTLPAPGTYRTAGQYVEMTPTWRRFQHFNGDYWGGVGRTIEEAQEHAAERSSFKPNFWRVPVENQNEECNPVQGHARRQGLGVGRSDVSFA